MNPTSPSNKLAELLLSSSKTLRAVLHLNAVSADIALFPEDLGYIGTVHQAQHLAAEQVSRLLQHEVPDQHGHLVSQALGYDLSRSEERQPC